MFINKTQIPLNLETWQPVKNGLSISHMKSILVKPFQNIVMESITGEWYVNTYIDDDSRLCKKLIDEGHILGEEIGKFRDHPCAQGDYVWLYSNNYEMEYSAGVVTITEIK